MSCMSGPEERAGADELRQALIALPVGLVALLAGALISGDGLADGASAALLLVGLIGTALGVLRLCQGLYKRVG